MANYLGGASPVGSNGQCNLEGKASRYVAGGNLWPGDFVKMNGSVTQVSIGNNPINLKQVVSAADNTNEGYVGVVIGKLVSTSRSGSSPVLDTPVGTAAPIASGEVVLVLDDPTLRFSIPCTGTVTVANLGLNAQIDVPATGSNGRSAMKVDSTYLNAGTNGATAPVKVLDIVDSPDNDGTGATSGTVVIVQINNHQLNPATGIAGT